MKNKEIRIVPITASKNRRLNDNFLYWIAGLTDGDGYFAVRNTKYKSKKTGKTTIYHYPSFEIVTHRVEASNIRKIAAVLNFGSVKRKSKNAYRFRVHDKISSRTLFNCLNGKIRLEKRLKQFKLVCNSMDIRSFGADKSNFDSNAWLSGFFEADGHFGINRRNMQFRVNITQVDPDLLYGIQNEFNGNVSRFFSKKSQTWCHRYECSKASDIIKWVAYFNKYSLIGPKKFQFVKFENLLLRKSNKELQNSDLRPLFLKDLIAFLEDKDYTTIIENAKAKNMGVEEFLNLSGKAND